MSALNLTSHSAECVFSAGLDGRVQLDKISIDCFDLFKYRSFLFYEIHLVVEINSYTPMRRPMYTSVLQNHHAVGDGFIL